MAEVCRACDVLFSRSVAVEVLRRTWSTTLPPMPGSGGRPRVAAELYHRSIIAVHDTGEARPYGVVLPFW